MPAKILFVDDEPDQAKLVQRMFRNKIRAGEIAFLFASDGEEALDVLREEPEIDLEALAAAVAAEDLENLEDSTEAQL